MRQIAALFTATVLYTSIATGLATAQQNTLPNGSEQYRPAFTAVHPASMLPPVVGKVVSYMDDRLVMDMRDGSVRTFLVSPSKRGGEGLLTQGKRLAVTVDTNGKVAFVALADQAATATVLNVTKDAVTLKLNDGRTLVLPSTALASMHGNVTPGMRMIFTTHDGGYTSSITPDKA